MIKYNPTHQKYESYANMIPDTHKNQLEIDNSKDDTRVKIGRLLTEEFQLSNFAKNPKKPSIAEVPIHVCVGIPHR